MNGMRKVKVLTLNDVHAKFGVNIPRFSELEAYVVGNFDRFLVDVGTPVFVMMDGKDCDVLERNIK